MREESHPGQVTGSPRGHTEGQTTTHALPTAADSFTVGPMFTSLDCGRMLEERPNPTPKRESNPCPCCRCGATELTTVPPSCPQFGRELFNVEIQMKVKEMKEESAGIFTAAAAAAYDCIHRSSASGGGHTENKQEACSAQQRTRSTCAGRKQQIDFSFLPFAPPPQSVCQTPALLSHPPPLVGPRPSAPSQLPFSFTCLPPHLPLSLS